jgi:hypothetical protein
MELDQASRNDHSAAIEAAGRLLQFSAHHDQARRFAGRVCLNARGPHSAVVLAGLPTSSLASIALNTSGASPSSSQAS